MSGSRIFLTGSSAKNSSIPKSEAGRHLYSNVALDVTGKGKLQNDETNNLRLNGAEISVADKKMSGYKSNRPTKRKYTKAMATLKPFRPLSKDRKLPINKAGLISYIFVTWLSPLIWKMFRKRTESVSEGETWECSDEEGLRVNTRRMIQLWEEELEKMGQEKASFIRVWWRFMSTRMLVSTLIITASALAAITSSGFLVNQVVSYLESEEDNLTLGIGLTVAVLLCEVTRAITLSTAILFSYHTGIWGNVLIRGVRVRSGFMGILFDKMLRMRTVKSKTNSEIINMFSMDSYRVYFVAWMIPLLLAVPIYIAIATVYSYILIGYWCFVAIGTFGFCYFGQTRLGRLYNTLRSKCVQYTDKRVGKIGEVLSNIKSIKMYAWEKPFVDDLKDIRKSEQKYLTYLALLNAIISSVIPVTPTVASVVTIAAYSAAGNTLTASTTFALIGTMNFLRLIVSIAPVALRVLGEAKVSFARLKRLLLMDEYIKPSADVFDKCNAVEIKSADFVWEEDADQMVDTETQKKMKRNSSMASVAGNKGENVYSFELTDINIEVNKTKLIGICGSVGSGKSSLMSAVIGRMTLKNGHLAVNGKVAYVAQQAWIFNASLKDNVLFGNNFDADRYRQAISCCGLDPDIKVLPNGNETEIGERGINLSGGQKQRVNLARAVYSDSDIFILDDPLSALDVKVGKQLFHACIQEALKDKTVLLVTHQLQYLQHCDEIFVMAEGRIEEKGDHQTLLALNGVYTKMFKIFGKTTVNQLDIDLDNGLIDERKDEIVAKQKGTQNGFSTCGHSEKNINKDKLIGTEEAAVGDVSLGTYTAYVQAAGGWMVAVLVVMAYFVGSGSVVFSDWWLSQWVTNLDMGKPGTNVYQNSTRPSQDKDSISANVMTRLPLNSTETKSYSSDFFSNVSSDTYLLVYIVSLVGVLVLQLFQGLCLAKASIGASSELYRNCLDKVMKAPMIFFDSNPVGRLLNRFSKDLDEGDVFLPLAIEDCLRNISLTVLTLGMAVSTSPWIITSAVPIMIVFGLMKHISKVSSRQLKRLENVSRSPLISHVNTTSQGLSSIVGYRQQKRFFDKCVTLGNVASVAIFLFDASMQWIAVRLDLTASMITVSTTLIFVLTKGLIAPASAGLILALYGKTVFIVHYLVRVTSEVEARFTSFERLNEYATTITSEPQHAQKMTVPEWPDKGTISFNDVIMRYRPDTNPVLRGVHFDIQSKEKVGIVGRTGAGKSSLAVSLFRLVELSGGNIYVDGEDISKLHLNTLRSKISTITQEPVLFAGTIRYNVDPFSKYLDVDIWEALEKVHIKEKIQQSEAGLDALIEENGENLSVGERQLVCLARVVLRKSKILLLDEATANIDTATDSLIQETIRECFADCTVITIAHRLNTVLNCDKIIVLDFGQVMECGSPQDLISNPHSFLYSMIHAQPMETPSPL